MKLCDTPPVVNNDDVICGACRYSVCCFVIQGSKSESTVFVTPLMDFVQGELEDNDRVL